jgi:NADP-dependent 3-hydroxy acid dehydrogenase YdfG
MSERFKDQVVVITGGGRGIGHATALEFAEEGAKLVLAGRRMDALRTAAHECRELGVAAEAVHCDVAVEDDLNGLATTAGPLRPHRRAGEQCGCRGRRPARRDRRDDVGRMVGVNIWAPVRLTQLVLPHMRRREERTVVNVSSLAGRMACRTTPRTARARSRCAASARRCDARSRRTAST